MSIKYGFILAPAESYKNYVRDASGIVLSITKAPKDDRMTIEFEDCMVHAPTYIVKNVKPGDNIHVWFEQLSFSSEMDDMESMLFHLNAIARIRKDWDAQVGYGEVLMWYAAVRGGYWNIEHIS